MTQPSISGLIHFQLKKKSKKPNIRMNTHHGFCIKSTYISILWHEMSAAHFRGIDLLYSLPCMVLYFYMPTMMEVLFMNCHGHLSTLSSSLLHFAIHCREVNWTWLATSHNACCNSGVVFSCFYWLLTRESNKKYFLVWILV